MNDLPTRSREEWSRDFWSELVNRTHLLSRRENVAEMFGWSVRLVWNEGRRGTIYLYNASATPFRQRERLRYVFTEFEPRREARLLLRQIASDRAVCT
jgi:hypothetical protein